MLDKTLKKHDPEIAELIEKERARQATGLEMIPSENHSSPAVRAALGSVLTDKYSEGYPKKRYYGGNQFIDQVEILAQERAKKLFGVPYANVQPYSGSPANQAVYFAVLEPGEVVMGQHLFAGGHLTHGWGVNFSGRFYQSVQYPVKTDGYLDLEEIRKLALTHKPKLIWCGATAYARELPFKAMGEIADEVGAYLAADIAHVAGLVAGGAHTSPEPFVHIITTTTHKTLRGPRGAMIMVTKKGLKKDPELAEKIDKAVFPGLQGGPHNHQTAAIAVALAEAMRPEFKIYADQIVKNAKALASSLLAEGIKLVSGGTDNHLILIDLTPFGPGKGLFAQEGLELAGITANKNTIPSDPSSAFYPSGLRLGTPALTTRGMKEVEMTLIGKLIATVLKKSCRFDFPEAKDEKNQAIKNFRQAVLDDDELKTIRRSVARLAKKFPLP
ncbi:MAG: serine hydroxymethyltransferase [Candidatus Buchananbacteria bacterium RIFCSPLOWO2_01_FULL_46_12]|uniref:Serine hydroxymethyltransferase n=2 Tax=Candidatus Buchananiibacteriota TaxID=1817903 RepID=A0A1G1YRJ2_9BACT|nr:MAG: serine hydroxymethyltransferase [Candidatus Buchananbacteria bacterium RIFCSPHIGHO2_01_FULL_44_11]OGY54924.1 MAG: serine hydroxymethyltransferase [Candidatus Buchananbacteria bacterium RIFCSPLOWO2_01_FULL_46_12]